jgi:TPR repeat protein
MRPFALLAALLACAAPAASQTTTEVLTARSQMGDGDMARALPELQRLAESGDPLAQAIYGSTFYYGDNGTVDAQQVLLWLQRGADQGYAPAIADLGWYYRYGMEGLEPNPFRARAEFERAAALGYPRAASELAAMLLEGAGGPMDVTRAIGLMRWAADMGDAFAAELLANEYYYGTNLEVNDWEARRLYMIAAAQNFYVSQEMLGRMAMNGEGGPQDLVLAQDALWQAMSNGLNSAGSSMAELLMANPDMATGLLDAAAHCVWAQRFASNMLTAAEELGCLPVLQGLSRQDLKEASRIAQDLVPAP